MESLHGQNHPSIADIMNNLGMLMKKEGKYNEALDYLKQAIKISKHYYGAKNPSIGIYLTNIGDIYRKVTESHRDVRIDLEHSSFCSKAILRRLKPPIKKP